VAWQAHVAAPRGKPDAGHKQKFLLFLLPSQLDAPAKKLQNSSTHPEADMGTLPMHQT
jgi:hypothetical protein